MTEIKVISLFYFFRPGTELLSPERDCTMESEKHFYQCCY